VVEARDTLAEVYDRLPRRVLLLTDYPGAAPILVRIALACGDRPRAELAATAAVRLADRNPGVASLAGVAAHATGLLHGDLDALREAVEHLRVAPRPLVRASALEDAALAEHAAQHRAAAVELLDEALTEAITCGANRSVARLERRLRTLGMRRAPARGP